MCKTLNWTSDSQCTRSRALGQPVDSQHWHAAFRAARAIRKDFPNWDPQEAVAIYDLSTSAAQRPPSTTPLIRPRCIPLEAPLLQPGSLNNSSCASSKPSSRRVRDLGKPSLPRDNAIFTYPSCIFGSVSLLLSSPSLQPLLCVSLLVPFHFFVDSSCLLQSKPRSPMTLRA